MSPNALRYAFERHVQFFGSHHCPGGRRSLPVIDLSNFDDDGPVTVNLDERIHGFQIEGRIIRSNTFSLAAL